MRGAELPLRYRLEVDYGEGGSFTLDDPYRFPPTLGDLDLHLIGEGRHEELYEKLGAHVIEHEGVRGTAFAVWAPSARAVSVVGDFNSWDGRLHPMRSLGAGGVWELFVPGVEAGARYKFELLAQDGDAAAEGRPVRAGRRSRRRETASVVTEPAATRGATPTGWRAARESRAARRADVDLRGAPGSWRRNPPRATARSATSSWPTSWRPTSRDMGFTHVELLPVMEHPFSGSWGYQVTGYFAPDAALRHARTTSASSSTALHQHGIGVILDWVPAHFPRDDFALARFDGTALYEHADPRRGAHPDWGTLIFNYGRNEVRNFLLASALYWLREYHADGLRVDAVASMLYLDYSREAGEWVPNEYGGREDLDAVAFLQAS